MAAGKRSLRRRVLVLGLASAVAPQLGLAGERDDFGLLDANGDGAIDRAEFAGLAAVLGGDAGLRTPPPATPARSLDAAPDVAPGVEVGADGAYVDCPCIDHVNDTAWAAVVSGHAVGDSALVVGGMVFPRDYGSASCRAWDSAASGFPGCTALDRNVNCYSAWCYVNGSRCQREDVSESLVFEGLHWSHFTCGDVGWFSNATNVSALLPIYAGDLTDRGHPTRAVQAPPVALRSNLRAACMFAYKVAERLGLGPSTLQYRALSDASKRKHDSSYTACVYDINIGNLDLCLGDWWFTAARSLMLVDFVPVFIEDMMLLVRKIDQAESMTVWDHLSKTFAPFSLGLWGVILGTLVVASVLMAVVEEEGVCSVRGPDGVPRGLATISTSLYQTALSFASFSTMLNPVTPAGKVLGLATAFFLTFVGACFTANTAQFLLTGAKAVRQVGSLPEFFDAGKRVCFSSPMLPILMQIDARIAQLGESQDADVLGPLRRGDCDGAITSTYRVQDAWADGDLCDYELVGSALHNYLVGFYTSVKLGHIVRHTVSSAMADGTWQSIRGVLEKGAACPSPEAAAHEIPRQLQFTHMLGNNLIFVASCVVSLAMHCLGKGLRASSHAPPAAAPELGLEDIPV